MTEVVVKVEQGGPDAEMGTEAEPAAAESGYDLPRMMVAEFFGTCFLVATIVGSGMMGDNLSPDDGVALLGNTLATWGILFVLITVFGPVSGADFNPVVSATKCCKRMIPVKQLLAFVPCQFAGGIGGAVVAHAMFNVTAIGAFEGKDRDTGGELFAEAVATVGLLVTIFGSIAVKAEPTIPMAVGLYITAGYWFTSSTSFANPAVTVARSFTDTFAGISPVRRRARARASASARHVALRSHGGRMIARRALRSRSRVRRQDCGTIDSHRTSLGLSRLRGRRRRPPVPTAPRHSNRSATTSWARRSGCCSACRS